MGSSPQKNGVAKSAPGEPAADRTKTNAKA
jgi:hypothetical protein